MNTMASQVTGVPLFAQLLDQGQIKENIKASRHWPLWGKFTGDRWVIVFKRGERIEISSTEWSILYHVNA